MLGGRIVESGGPDLALHLEEHGYDWIKERVENEAAA
jgi:Fe-S cluster assembly ATP-binding protein